MRKFRTSSGMTSDDERYFNGLMARNEDMIVVFMTPEESDRREQTERGLVEMAREVLLTSGLPYSSILDKRLGEALVAYDEARR